MKFTLNRDLTIASVSGHSIAFAKGKPTHVPKSMHHEVLAAGAIATDVDKIEFDDQKQLTVESPEDPTERAELIRQVLADIKARDVREEFTANGTPRMKTVQIALGFEVLASEIADQWKALAEADAENTDE